MKILVYRMLTSLFLFAFIFANSPGIVIAQQNPLGNLSITGRSSNITINGERVSNGLSVSSPADIVTATETNATVTIVKIGRIEFAPNSRMNLDFTPSRIGGTFSEGQITVAVAKNVGLNIQTVDGIITTPDQQQENIAVIDLENGKTRVRTIAGIVALNGVPIQAGTTLGGVTAKGVTGATIGGNSAFIPVAIFGGLILSVLTGVALSNDDDEITVSPIR